MPLIVFEGIDGCGKSTQAKLLAARLRAAGKTVRELREPGGTALGEAIRTLLLDPATQAGARAELLAYQVARAQLVDAVLRPALAAGEHVLLDRYYHSTIAYQAYGLGLPLALVRQAIAVAIDGLHADLAFWLRLSVAEGARRRAAARGHSDRIEQRGLEYLEKVHGGYQALADAGELIALDASLPSEQVAQQIAKRVAAL